MQVRAKAQALNQFLRSMQGPGRAYTLLQLSRRLLSYCEAQVALSHPSAFAVAEVTASVLGMHADFAPILLGKLHEVSQSSTAVSSQSYGTAAGYLSLVCIWAWRGCSKASTIILAMVQAICWTGMEVHLLLPLTAVNAGLRASQCCCMQSS